MGIMICKYCEEEDNSITGKSIGYSSRKLVDYIDYLNLFILKGASDEKAGLMIENTIGARYIDINYCPFCGRKLGGINENSKRDV